MFNFLAGRMRQRATIRELTALSDRELADLGIRRTEISRVVRGSAGETRAAEGRSRGFVAPSWAVQNRRVLATDGTR